MGPELSTSDWVAFASALAGGLVGALAGGLATFVASYFQFRLQSREVSRSNALKALLKASLIGSDFRNVQNHFLVAIENAELAGRSDDALWTKVPPVPGKSEPIVMTSDDLLTFSELGLYSLVERMMTVGMRHKAVCDAIDHYSARRIHLGGIVEVIDVEGSVAASDYRTLSSEARTIMLEIDTLGNSMVNFLPSYIEEADQLVSQMSAELKKHFGSGVPRIVPLSRSERAEMARSNMAARPAE